MAEYARIDADGNILEDVRLALGLATVGVLWSLLAIGLIAWMLS